jgi:hypothetical protein
MAVGLSARLLRALQPVPMLVRYDVIAGISETRQILRRNLPKYETSNGDRIRSQILRVPRKAWAHAGPLLVLARKARM